MDNLQILHDLESYIGYDLDVTTGDSVIDYLNDDPCSTEPNYLAELFGLEPASTKSRSIKDMYHLLFLLDRVSDTAKKLQSFE